MDLLGSQNAVAAALWALLSAALAFSAAVPLALRPPSLSPERAQALRDELHQKIASGYAQEALFLVNRLRRAFPEDSTYLVKAAELYHRLEDHRSEGAAYEMVLALSPTPTEACPALGRAYADAGLPARAFEAHRRCHELDPSDVDLRLYYGLALERAGDYEAAWRRFEEVLAVAPRYADAKIGLARLETARSRPREALRRLRALPLKERGLPDARQAEARALEELEKIR